MKQYQKILILFSVTLGFYVQSAESKISLLPLEKKGCSAYSIKKLAQSRNLFIKGKPRTTPHAVFIQKNNIQRQGTLQKVSIPLELLNEAAVARNAAVRIGVPMPRGGVFSLNKFHLKNNRGQSVPAQFAATALWPDKSLKWVLVQFDAPLQQAQRVTYCLEAGEQIKPLDNKGMKLTQNNNTVTINTGKMTAVIDKRKFNVINKVDVNGRLIGSFAPGGVRLTGENGKVYTMGKPDAFAISEQGDERITLRVAGRYFSLNGKETNMSYVARLFFYRDKSSFTLSLTHINSNTKREFTDFDSLDLEFLPAATITGGTVQLTSSVVDFAAHGKPQRVFQETDEFYSIDNGQRVKGRMPGGMNIITPQGQIAVAIKDCYQRYPKAFATAQQGKSLKIELLPGQPNARFNQQLPIYLRFPFCEGKYRMKWGMSFTEDIVFDFDAHGLRPNQAEANLPVIAVVPPSWYGRCNVFAVDEPNAKLFDTALNEAFDARRMHSENQHEYGFLNYGDGYGERGTNWANNEYDTAHLLFTAFTRTGRRDLFRAALAAARHSADVDVIHAYPDPFYIGASPVHSIAHTGSYKKWTHAYNKYATAVNGHTWSNGRIDAWHLSGDAGIFDTVYKLGDHISQAMAPNFDWGATERVCGWALIAICAIYEATGDPTYLKAADRLADQAKKYWKSEQGGIWARTIQRLQSTGDKTLGSTLFVTAILIKGLCDYYQITHRADILEIIAASAQWCANALDKTDGCGFFYDSSWDGKPLNYSVAWLNAIIAPPLAKAAVLTDNKKLFETAQKAMAVHALRGFNHSAKGFCTSQAFLNCYLNSAKQWREKHPHTLLEGSRQQMLQYILQEKQPSLHLRVRGKNSIILRQTAPHSQVLLQRYRCGSPIKQLKNTLFVLRAADGKTIVEKTFNSGNRVEDFAVTLPGRPGSKYTLEIDDNFSGSWNLIPDKNYLAAISIPPQGCIFSKVSMQRFYFWLPPGGKVKIDLYGVHSGPYGFWLFDENGTLIASRHSRSAAFSHAPGQSAWISADAQGGKHGQLFSYIFYSQMDAGLRAAPATIFSGDKNFFQR